MRRLLFSAVLLCMSQWLFARGGPLPSRPTVYAQVDEVRKELKLDQKQFDKVYSAYEKFDKAVFGDSDSRDSGLGRPQGGGPGKGGPGGAPGKPGQDGMSASKEHKQLPPDLEKLEKTKAKQEEKLDKSMKKLFKNNNELYTKWKALREAQLRKLFPPFHPS